MAITKGAVDNLQVENRTMNPSLGQGTNSGTVSSILKARDIVNQSTTEMKSGLLSSSQDMDDLIRKYDKIKQKIDEIGKTDAGAKFISGFKELNQIAAKLENMKNSQEELNQVIESGNVSTDKLRQLYYSVQSEIIDCTDALSDYEFIAKNVNKSSVKEQKSRENINKALKEEGRQRKINSKLRKEAIKEEENELKKLEKEAAKSSTKALGESLRRALTTIKDTLVTNVMADLSNMTQRSAAAEIELDYMKSYNLTKSEFNDMKKAIYHSVDTEVYTNKNIQSSFGILINSNLTTTDEIKRYASQVVKSTQLLGLSEEQQQKMLKTSNKLNYDYYTFATNRLATYITKDLGFSKQQVSELAALNENLVSSMSNYDVNSEEFAKSAMAEQAGLEALGMKDYQNNYSSTMQRLVSGGAEQVTGLSANEARNQLNNGSYLSDILKNNNALSGKFWDEYVARGYKTDAYMESSFQEAGLSKDTQDLIKQYAKAEKEKGDLHSYFDSLNTSQSTDSQAMKELEKSEKDNTSTIKKFTNKFENWLGEKIDWLDLSDFETSMSAIIKLLGIIAAADVISAGADIVKGIKGLFKGTGKGIMKFAGKANGGAGLGLAKGSGMWATAGSGGKGLFGAGMGTTALGVTGIAAGTIWGGIDAYNSVKNADENFGKGHKIGAGVSGFLAGSKIHKDAEGKVDTGKNIGKGALSGAGKGALIGAGIGTFFGPGVVTAIGGAIGGVIGGIGGALSGWWKGSKAKEQEKKQQEELEKIQENTASTADNTKKTNLEMTRFASADRTTYVARSTGIGSDTSSPMPTQSAIQKSSDIGFGSDFTGAKGQYYGPWVVTSPFGVKRTYTNTQGKTITDTHSGIDLAKGGTQNIYAVAGGKVSYGYYPSGGGNQVVVDDGNGHRYVYCHLKYTGLKTGDTVARGDAIGIMGATGNVTGQHLHFGVKSGGSNINPVPYLNSSIYSGGGSTDGLNGSSGSKGSRAPRIDDVSNALRETGTKVILDRVSQMGIGSPEPIVNSITDLKQTLIDISDRQTRDERIMNMLSNQPRQSTKLA